MHAPVTVKTPEIIGVGWALSQCQQFRIKSRNVCLSRGLLFFGRMPPTPRQSSFLGRLPYRCPTSQQEDFQIAESLKILDIYTSAGVYLLLLMKQPSVCFSAIARVETPSLHVSAGKAGPAHLPLEFLWMLVLGCLALSLPCALRRFSFDEHPHPVNFASWIIRPDF